MSQDNEAYINEEVKALRDGFDEMMAREDARAAQEAAMQCELEDGTVIWL
jgi:hypothetical protein